MYRFASPLKGLQKPAWFYSLINNHRNTGMRWSSGFRLHGLWFSSWRVLLSSGFWLNLMAAGNACAIERWRRLKRFSFTHWDFLHCLSLSGTLLLVLQVRPNFKIALLMRTIIPNGMTTRQSICGYTTFERTNHYALESNNYITEER